MRFDLDPSMHKVCIIGLLTFLETLIVAILAILQTGDPTLMQIMVAILGSCLVLVTYFLTFFKTGEVPETQGEKPE